MTTSRVVMNPMVRTTVYTDNSPDRAVDRLERGLRIERVEIVLYSSSRGTDKRHNHRQLHMVRTLYTWGGCRSSN